MIRSQIPRFRLPEEVIDEEVGYIVGIGNIETRYGERVDSLRTLLDEDFDASSSARGAARARSRYSRAAGRRPGTSISGSTGSRTSPSAISTRSAAASSCSAAATPRWIAAAPPAASAART